MRVGRFTFVLLSGTAVRCAKPRADERNLAPQETIKSQLEQALDVDYFNDSLDGFRNHSMWLIDELKQQVQASRFFEPEEILGDIVTEMRHLRDTNFEQLNDKLLKARKRRDRLEKLILTNPALGEEQQERLLQNLRSDWNLFVKRRSILAADMEDAIVESLKIAKTKGEAQLVESTGWEQITKMTELRLAHFGKVFRTRIQLAKHQIDDLVDARDGIADALGAIEEFDLFRRDRMDGGLERIKEKLDAAWARKKELRSGDDVASALLEYDYAFEKRNIQDMHHILTYATRRLQMALVPGLYDEYVAQEEDAQKTISHALHMWRRRVDQAESTVEELVVSLKDGQTERDAKLGKLSKVRKRLEVAEEDALSAARRAELAVSLARDKALDTLNKADIDDHIKKSISHLLSKPPIPFSLVMERLMDEVEQGLDDFKELQHDRDMEIRRGFLQGQFETFLAESGQNPVMPSLEDWKAEVEHVEQVIQGTVPDGELLMKERHKLVQLLEGSLEKLGESKAMHMQAIRRYLKFLETQRMDREWLVTHAQARRKKTILKMRKAKLLRRRTISEAESMVDLEKRDDEGDNLGAGSASNPLADPGDTAYIENVTLATELQKELLQDYERILALETDRATAILKAMPDIPEVHLDAFWQNTKALREQLQSEPAQATRTDEAFDARVREVEALIEAGSKIRENIMAELNDVYRGHRMTYTIKRKLVDEGDASLMEQISLSRSIDTDWEEFQKEHDLKISSIDGELITLRDKAVSYLDAMSRRVEDTKTWTIRYELMLKELAEVATTWRNRLQEAYSLLKALGIDASDSISERDEKEEEHETLLSQLAQERKELIDSIESTWDEIHQVKTNAAIAAQKQLNQALEYHIYGEWGKLVEARETSETFVRDTFKAFADALQTSLVELRSMRVKFDLKLIEDPPAFPQHVSSVTGTVYEREVVHGYAQVLEGQCQAEFVMSIPLQAADVSTTVPGIPLQKSTIAEAYIATKLKLLGLARKREMLLKQLEERQARMEAYQAYSIKLGGALNSTQTAAGV